MKHCLVDGTTYPDAISRCRGCGAPLFYVPTAAGFPGPKAAATAGCPNPECSTLVSLAGTKFCGQCGRELAPLSFDLWLQKIVEPAFVEDPLRVLLNTAILMPAVAELGLDRKEATKHLDQFLVQSAGAVRSELVEWLRDAMIVLTDRANDLDAGKRFAEELATERKIFSSFASLIVEQFARDIESAAVESDARESPNSSSLRNAEEAGGPVIHLPFQNPTSEQQPPAANVDAKLPAECVHPAQVPRNEDTGAAAANATTGKVDFTGAPSASHAMPLTTEQPAQQETSAVAQLSDAAEKKGKDFTAKAAVVAIVAVVGFVLGIYFVLKPRISAWSHETPTTVEAANTPSPPPSPLPSPPDGMVKVDGGDLEMVGDEGIPEQPPRKVPVLSFYLDIAEVTCGQYQAFLAESGRSMPSGWKERRCPPGSEELPVTGVDWYDASAYAESKTKRLPKEEEWELAARGEKARRYPWGNDWDSNAANAGTLSQRHLVKGCLYEAGKTEHGICDLIGNVWEWTSTAIARYPGGRPQAPTEKEMKVIRGGAYDTDEALATATYRGYWPAQGTNNEKAYGFEYSKMGFRCAKSIE